MEAWMHTFAFPGRVAPLAAQVEEWGFAGLLVADSQNLNAEVWIELALAAASTEWIGLGPGVTNPLTRHPAVTASAAATLQAESTGRAVLGLGRGDSALAQIGRRPAAPDELECALATIQAYLRGEAAALGDFSSRIAWLPDGDRPKVPVAVAATGPHVIAAAARHAERIDFTVGAEPDRLRWAIDQAQAAAGGHELSLGAYLNVAVHPDRALARDLVRGSTAIFARFATEGAPTDGLSDVTREGIERLAGGYDEAPVTARPPPSTRASSRTTSSTASRWWARRTRCSPACRSWPAWASTGSSSCLARWTRTPRWSRRPTRVLLGRCCLA